MIARIEQWFKNAIGRGMNPDKAYGYQCKDVADDYCIHLFGDWINTIRPADAKNAFANANPDYFIKIANNLNDPNLIPQRGDIIIWGASQANPWGHIAVVVSADRTGAVVIEQDGFRNTIPAYQAKRGYIYAGMPCIGWLRPRPEKIIGYTPPAPAPTPPAPEPPKVEAPPAEPPKSAPEAPQEPKEQKPGVEPAPMPKEPEEAPKQNNNKKDEEKSMYDEKAINELNETTAQHNQLANDVAEADEVKQLIDGIDKRVKLVVYIIGDSLIGAGLILPSLAVALSFGTLQQVQALSSACATSGAFILTMFGIYKSGKDK